MLEKLPILNTVTVRAGKAFRKDAKRMSREEAWVGTERGERAEKPCDRCSRGNNPFTDCCTAEGTYSIRHPHPRTTAKLSGVKVSLRERVRIATTVVMQAAAVSIKPSKTQKRIS
jgi:hypothetical protein